MNEYERQHQGAPGDETRGQSPQEIEREIEATRERMSRDIDELEERLSPENLKRQAREAISGRAQNLAHFIQENTSLVAAMGLGAVWLIQQRNRSEISGDRMARFAYTGPERRREGMTGGMAGRAGRVREGVRDRVSAAAGTARGLGEQAVGQTRRARGGLERLVEDSPLAVAAGVAVLGLACGLLVPESEREQRLMGPARDDLAHRAQETVRRVKEVAVEAGRELGESVREEVSTRAPEVKAVVQDAVQSVGDQVKEQAGRVKEEAKQAARAQRPGRGAAPA
jgi:gas vesicle protein